LKDSYPNLALPETAGAGLGSCLKYFLNHQLLNHQHSCQAGSFISHFPFSKKLS
jgi:hypothetical protein